MNAPTTFGAGHFFVKSNYLFSVNFQTYLL